MGFTSTLSFQAIMMVVCLFDRYGSRVAREGKMRRTQFFQIAFPDACPRINRSQAANSSSGCIKKISTSSMVA